MATPPPPYTSNRHQDIHTHRIVSNCPYNTDVYPRAVCFSVLWGIMSEYSCLPVSVLYSVCCNASEASLTSGLPWHFCQRVVCLECFMMLITHAHYGAHDMPHNCMPPIHHHQSYRHQCHIVSKRRVYCLLYPRRQQSHGDVVHTEQYGNPRHHGCAEHLPYTQR